MGAGKPADVGLFGGGFQHSEDFSYIGLSLFLALAVVTLL